MCVHLCACACARTQLIYCVDSNTKTTTNIFCACLEITLYTAVRVVTCLLACLLGSCRASERAHARRTTERTNKRAHLQQRTTTKVEEPASLGVCTTNDEPRHRLRKLAQLSVPSVTQSHRRRRRRRGTESEKSRDGRCPREGWRRQASCRTPPRVAETAPPCQQPAKKVKIKHR